MLALVCFHSIVVGVDHDLFDLEISGICGHIRAIREEDGQGKCNGKREHSTRVRKPKRDENKDQISQESKDQSLKADKSKDKRVF